MREQVRVDLHDRADHRERPVGPHAGHLADHRVVDALVDDAEPPEDRAGHEVDVGRDDGVSGRAALSKWLILDAAAEDVHVVVLLLLLLAEVVAAGEDDVGVLA